MSTSGATENGGAAIFPNYAGSGSPEGVVTAAVGKSYLDTTNGAIYEKGEGSGDTGWVVAGGATQQSVLPGAFVDLANEWSALIAPVGEGKASIISDPAAQAGTFNGLYYNTQTGGDGNQDLALTLGSSGQFFWAWSKAGLTSLPGGLAIAAADSHTATAAFSTLAVDTPLQSSLAYDVLVSGTIRISSATAGTIALGVGSGATPTTDPFLTSLTSATEVVVGYSAVVPAGYYLSFVTGGTIVVASLTAVATPL